MEAIKLKPNEILAKHGATGGLIRRLQRYALLGWVLFFLMLVFHFVYVMATGFMPRPVVVVDEGGKILGNLEYLSPNTRSDGEIIAASKQFATWYMSMNAESIYDDMALAMNMMGADLLDSTSKAFEADNYLARVATARAKSRLVFSKAQIMGRQGMTAKVRLAGEIIIDAGGKEGAASKPFDITLDVEAVARNTSNTTGLKIISRKDN